MFLILSDRSTAMSMPISNGSNVEVVRVLSKVREEAPIRSEPRPTMGRNLSLWRLINGRMKTALRWISLDLASQLIMPLSNLSMGVSGTNA